MKRIFILVILGSCFQTGRSQEHSLVETTHLLYGGVSQYILRDALAGHASLQADALAIGYLFSRQLTNRKRSFSVSWQRTLFSGEERVTLHSFEGRFANGFRLFNNKSNNRLTAYAGYSISSHPSFMSVGDKERRYTWTTINSLNFYNAWDYQWKNNFLTLDIDIPLAGLASRPLTVDEDSYEANINGVLYKSFSDLFFTSLHNYKAVSARLEYRHSVRPGVQLYAGLQYRVKDLRVEINSYGRSAGLQGGVVFKIK